MLCTVRQATRQPHGRREARGRTREREMATVTGHLQGWATYEIHSVYEQKAKEETMEQEEEFYSIVMGSAKRFEEQIRVTMEKKQETNNPMDNLLKKIRKLIGGIKFIGKLNITRKEENIMLSGIVDDMKEFGKKLSAVKLKRDANRIHSDQQRSEEGAQ